MFVIQISLFFVGKKSNDEEHPHYVPTIFPQKAVTEEKNTKTMNRFGRKKKREQVKATLKVIEKKQEIGFRERRLDPKQSTEE